jgi:C4-dicarboxylate-specific signal transduction histidine kinase
LLAAGLVEQRRRAIKQRLANQAALQAANDMLEIRVQERTAELRARKMIWSMPASSPPSARCRPESCMN